MTDRTNLLSSATTRLEAAGVVGARHDAELLLAHVIGLPRAELHSVGEVDSAVEERFLEAVGRRTQRVPLQHITGSAPFRYLDLAVGPGVFIPRPETEVMTGLAIDEVGRLLAAGVSNPIVVDLCTGSGAVALAIATEAHAARVSAVEVSADAHRYAAANAAALGIDLDLRLGDVADAVDDLAGRVHIVTANPPYIPLDAYESVEAEVRDFDPAVALWSGDDGLELTRVVEQVAARLLVDGGLVLSEHADVQGESAPAVFAASGRWTAVRDNRDLADKPRFVTARRVDRTLSSPGTMSS